MSDIQVFRYVEELDAFVVTDDFEFAAERLGLQEWDAGVVWLGRLFALDQDYGEHWFDNWDERQARKEKANALGIHEHDLMVVCPERFAAGSDGPCHSDEVRKMFWTDVLKSLRISCVLMFGEARDYNERKIKAGSRDYIPDLDDRIEQIAALYGKTLEGSGT